MDTTTMTMIIRILTDMTIIMMITTRTGMTIITKQALPNISVSASWRR